MDKSLIAVFLLFPLTVLGQTHTMPGSNVVPSGASLTIQSGGTLTAAGGSTVTGIGGGNVSNSGTPTAAQIAAWTDATHIQGIANTMAQWDGGATGLTAATGRTSLGGTTVGQSFFTLANPGAVSFPEISAGNAVSAVSAATMRTDLAVQPLDTDLTTWAGITPVAAVGTWIATPSSANLRSAMTDENGTGAALFSGATTPDFTTGFTIGAAAASGKIPIGNGTNYVPSTPTFSNAPSTALKWMRSDGTNWITSTSLLSDTPSTAGKVLISDGTNWITSTPTYPNAAGAVGYTIRSDATNFASFPAQLINSSVTSQSPTTSDVYLAGSNIVVTAGDMKAKGQYKCVFDMTKSTGTGAIVITLRVGTAGTTSDAAIQTYTFGAGTSVADFGLFEVIATWRTVGSGTSAVMQGMCRGTHQLATTGLFNNAAGWMVLGSPSPSSGFNSSTATNIGISFNGSTAFAGTTQVVQSQLQQ